MVTDESIAKGRLDTHLSHTSVLKTFKYLFEGTTPTVQVRMLAQMRKVNPIAVYWRWQKRIRQHAKTLNNSPVKPSKADRGDANKPEDTPGTQPVEATGYDFQATQLVEDELPETAQ